MNFAAEFVRRTRFALADAFGFRRVPGIQIALVAALLLRDMPGASRRRARYAARTIPPARAPFCGARRGSDAAIAPAEISPAAWRVSSVARAGIGPSSSLRAAARTYGLRNRSPVFFALSAELFDRRQQPVFGRMRNRFFCTVVSTATAGGAHSAPRRDRRGQRLLQQRLQRFIAHALAKMRHPRSPSGKSVENILYLANIACTDQLPLAHRFVRQPFDVLQQMQSHHQPDRQPRSSRLAIVRRKMRLQPLPVDQLAQPHQLMLQIDDVP